MSAPMLIVGQGIAGTMLAWEFERAGMDFEIADAGHSGATSRMAAGIINPITGQRLVKSWRVDALLPAAWAAYAEIGKALGIAVVRRMRVWRQFVDAGERMTFGTKYARGELAPFAVSYATAWNGTEGFWIEPALHVDLPLLIAEARRRWLSQGRLTERRVEPKEETSRRDLVIDCTGAAAASLGVGRLDRVKGEVLTLTLGSGTARALEPDVIRNRGHWLVPLIDHARAMVGATYDRTAVDLAPLPASRSALERSARELLGGNIFKVDAHLAGWRVNAADRRPIVGRIVGDPQIGFINGLGSKGALYAPWLARQWVNHLTEGVPFE